jgi:hypothetical protein
VAQGESRDLFSPEILKGELTPEFRQELMSLSRTLRSAAEQIDRIVARKSGRELDENQEQTFRFKARVTIPDDFYITKRLAKYAFDRGFNEEQVKHIAQNFVNWYKKKGTKWMDWSRVWMDWIRQEQQRLRTNVTPMTSDRLQKL